MKNFQIFKKVLKKSPWFYIMEYICERTAKNSRFRRVTAAGSPDHGQRDRPVGSPSHLEIGENNVRKNGQSEGDQTVPLLRRADRHPLHHQLRHRGGARRKAQGAGGKREERIGVNTSPSFPDLFRESILLRPLASGNRV